MTATIKATFSQRGRIGQSRRAAWLVMDMPFIRAIRCSGWARFKGAKDLPRRS